MDTSNNKGEHEQIDKPCLCTESTETLYIDWDKEQVVCGDCHKSRPFLTHYQYMSEQEIINSYLE